MGSPPTSSFSALLQICTKHCCTNAVGLGREGPRNHETCNNSTFAVAPLTGDKDLEDSILRGLRGKARMLVGEKEFLRPLTSEAGWKLGG